VALPKHRSYGMKFVPPVLRTSIVQPWSQCESSSRFNLPPPVSRLNQNQFWLTLLIERATLNPMKADPALLQAALFGYESRLAQINQAIAEIRRTLSQSTTAGTEPAAPARKRRKMSPAARKRIAAAQKKRWAAFKKSKGES
jgi:hypothetical protein